MARHLPYTWVKRACLALGALYYHVAFRWRALWLARLRACGLSGREDEILFKKFQNYILNLAEIARIASFRRENFRIYGRKHLRASALQGKGGAVLVSIHMGNWELAGAGLALYGFPATTVAWRSKNPYIESMQTRRRRAHGIETAHPGEGAMDALLRALHKGGVVGMMLDVSLPGRGVDVSFLGREVSFSPSALWLALGSGAPVLPVFCVREEDGRCRITVLRPCRPRGTDHIGQDLQMLSRTFERVIMKYPDQYHWLKERA